MKITNQMLHFRGQVLGLPYIFNRLVMDNLKYSDNQLDRLIKEYVEACEVTSAGSLLELLVSITSEENYLVMTSKIDKHHLSSEIDLSMYIHEITKESFPKLERAFNPN